MRLPVNRGIAGWVAMSGETIRIADVATDRGSPGTSPSRRDYVPTTILAAPVVDSHGEIAGVVEVLDPAEGWGLRPRARGPGLMASPTRRHHPARRALRRRWVPGWFARWLTRRRRARSTRRSRSLEDPEARVRPPRAWPTRSGARRPGPAAARWPSRDAAEVAVTRVTADEPAGMVCGVRRDGPGRVVGLELPAPRRDWAWDGRRRRRGQGRDRRQRRGRRTPVGRRAGRRRGSIELRPRARRAAYASGRGGARGPRRARHGVRRRSSARWRPAAEIYSVRVLGQPT